MLQAFVGGTWRHFACSLSPGTKSALGHHRCWQRMGTCPRLRRKMTQHILGGLTGYSDSGEILIWWRQFISVWNVSTFGSCIYRTGMKSLNLPPAKAEGLWAPPGGQSASGGGGAPRGQADRTFRGNSSPLHLGDFPEDLCWVGLKEAFRHILVKYHHQFCAARLQFQFRTVRFWVLAVKDLCILYASFWLYSTPRCRRFCPAQELYHILLCGPW